MTAFQITQKVGFQHCDPAGMVFYPRYFEMFNLTVEEWFAQRLGIPFEVLHGPMQSAIPTVQLTTKFLAPSILGDVLEFRLTPVRLGNSSLDISVEAVCGSERRLTIKSTIVFIAIKERKSKPWPEKMALIVKNDINGLAHNHA